MKSKLPKLVRDRIPSIIEQDHLRIANISILDDDSYRFQLIEKFHEEIDEYQFANTYDHKREELGDILELFQSMLKIEKIRMNDVINEMNKKRQTNGAFNDCILLESIEEGQNDFLANFKQIIRYANVTNTYKMAWAKAIVEICTFSDLVGSYITISLDQMAKKFIKYYWDQTIFFNLNQGSNLTQLPIIITIIKELIESYFKHCQNRKPVHFNRALPTLENELIREYDKAIKQTIHLLKQDVSHRFQTLYKHKICLYPYTKYNLSFNILTKDALSLRSNSDDLFDLIHYHWAMILENFNHSPRISKKVRILSEPIIKRNNLNKFKALLSLENPDHICFLCGEAISDHELSIDHVIPWSYLYSDDIWNLVYAHRSCNSSKLNAIPTKNMIDSLIQRNDRLLSLMNLHHLSGKLVDELKLAIERDFVTQFWIGCKN